MKLSTAGLNFISQWEAFRADIYLDASGYETIGFGHLIVDDDPIDVWRANGVSAEEALHRLTLDAGLAEESVGLYVTPVLTTNQFDALVSWTFNCGTGALRSSTLLKRLNRGNHDEVPGQLQRWNKGRDAAGNAIVLDGLVRRREAEAWLWTMSDYGSGP